MSGLGSSGRDGIWFEVGAEVANALDGLRRVEAQLRSFRSAAAEAKRAGEVGITKGIEQSVTRTTGLLREARTQITGFFDTAFRGLVAGDGAVSVALGGVGAAAVSLGQDFESSMARVSAISGAAGAEIQALTDKAREMGRDLPISATDAANAFTTLAQRGYDAKTMMGMVDEVTKLAISQQADMESAADLLGSTMKAFGLEVSDAGRLVDIYNNACNDSALAMNHFQVALKYVAPNAAALGISLEDTVAAMEALADAGFTAETMGTGLRMVFTRLGQAMGDGGGEFKKLGVEITDASGKLLPLSQIFENMAQKTLSLAELQKIFGVEAATAAAQLQKVAGSLGTYRAGLKVAGTAQANMARYMETTKVKIDDLRSSIDEIRLSVFDQLKEKLGGVLDGLKGGADAFSDWVKETKAIQAAVEGLAEGLGLGASGLEDFKVALRSINVSEVRGQFRDFAEGTKALGRALLDLASLVPWRAIIDNLDTIAVTITSMWAAGKIAAVISTISALSAALVVLRAEIIATGVALAASPIALTLGFIAVAAGAAGTALWNMSKAQEAAIQSAKGADDMERWAVDFKRAIDGSAEALKLLPPHLQKIVEARKAGDASARGEIQTLHMYRAALLGNEDALSALPPAVRTAAAALSAAGRAGGAASATARDYEAAINGDIAALKRLPEAVRAGIKTLHAQAAAAKRAAQEHRGLSAAQGAAAESASAAQRTYEQVVSEEMDLWRARLDVGRIGGDQYLSLLDRFAADEKLKEITRLRFLKEAQGLRADVNRKSLEEVEKQEESRRDSARRGMEMVRLQAESEARIREAAASDEIERERSRIQWLESLGMTSAARRLQMESDLVDQERAVRQRSADEALSMARAQYAAEMRELGSTHVNLQAAEIEHTETMLQIDQAFHAKKAEIDRQAYEDQNHLQIRAQNLMQDAEQAVADLSLEFGVGLTNALASAASGMGSLSDALKSLGADIAYTIIRATLLKTILGALGFAGGTTAKAPTAGLGSALKSMRASVAGQEDDGAGGWRARSTSPSSRSQGTSRDAGRPSVAGGNTVVQVTIQALDSKSFADMARSNRLVFESMVVENVMRNGAIRKAMRGAG